MLRALVRDRRQCLPVIGALAFDLFAQVFYLLPCLFSLSLTLNAGIFNLLTQHLNFDLQSTVLDGF
jgi:hypothetical protein